jgi:2-iminobutanoate/2-iminopropanoate deaminase
MKRFMLVLTFAVCLAQAFGIAAEARSPNGRRAVQKSGRAATKSAPRVEYLKNVGGTRQLPFSEAVRVGDVLYLSGQIGVDANGAVVAGGIEAETRQTLENIRATLARHGSAMDNVVKCTVMLADIRSDYAPMNAVYRTFFRPERMPARSTFGTSGLALGARVEIECLATAR